MSAIAGPLSEGCAEASAGHGYYDATTYTDGVFASICDDPATTMMAIGQGATAIGNVFTLSQTPIEKTIRVRVNNNFHASWTYDSTTLSVTLTADMPSEGEGVRIDYQAETGR